MMLLPAVAAAGALFVTLTSACDVMVVDTDEALLFPFKSSVDVDTVAAFNMNVAPKPEGMWMTTVKDAETPGASEAMVQVLLGAFLVQVNVGPLVCVIETNVVFGGSDSVIDTFDATDGPLFVTTTV